MNKAQREEIRQRAQQRAAEAALRESPLAREAAASVALDKDQDCGTQSLPQQPAPKKKKPPLTEAERDKQRLPDGSEYHKWYDGELKQWKVELVVPTASVTFVAHGNGSMSTEFKADKMYRKWLADQAPITDA